MDTRASEKLPYGIGQWSGGSVLVVGLSVVFIALGIFAYSRQLIEGEIVTGLRNIGSMGGATWGLYVVFVVYFVGVSFAGITIAALIRIFDLKHLKPVSRIAELLTIIALILGTLSILADVGQPLRALIYLPLYARPMSPFFYTFTLVISGYLCASLVYFYLDGRRDAAILAMRTSGALRVFYRLWAAGYRDTPAERERHGRASFWLALSILPMLITAHSTLGFVFGLQVARPGWFSALQAPGFVLLAGVSGVGCVIFIAAILRRVLGVEEQLNLELFKWLARVLIVLTVGYLYFMGVEWLTATYTGHHHELRVSAALLSGEYSWLFWGVVLSMVIALGALILCQLPEPAVVKAAVFQPVVARLAAAGAAVVAVVMLLFPPTQEVGLTLSPLASEFLAWLLVALLALVVMSLLARLQGHIIAGAVLGGILVNLAAIGKRFLIVVPSQTHGTLLPYSVGSYSPSWVEYSVILGLLGLGMFLYTVFVKVFPITEVEEAVSGGR